MVLNKEAWQVAYNGAKVQTEIIGSATREETVAMLRGNSKFVLDIANSSDKQTIHTRNILGEYVMNNEAMTKRIRDGEI